MSLVGNGSGEMSSSYWVGRCTVDILGLQKTRKKIRSRMGLRFRIHVKRCETPQWCLVALSIIMSLHIMNKHPLKDQFSGPFWMCENEDHYVRKCFMLILMETRISKHGNRMCGMKFGNTNDTAYLLDPNVIVIYTINKDNDSSKSPHTCRQHVKETDDSITWTPSVAKTAEIGRWGWGERWGLTRRRRWWGWGGIRQKHDNAEVHPGQLAVLNELVQTNTVWIK